MRPAKAGYAYAQSDQSICWSLECCMNFKLLTEQNLEFLSLKGRCIGSPESTLVKMLHCLKSSVMAHMLVGIWVKVVEHTIIRKTLKQTQWSIYHRKYHLHFAHLK